MDRDLPEVGIQLCRTDAVVLFHGPVPVALDGVQISHPADRAMVIGRGAPVQGVAESRTLSASSLEEAPRSRLLLPGAAPSGGDAS